MSLRHSSGVFLGLCLLAAWGSSLTEAAEPRRIPWTTSKFAGTPEPPPPYRLRAAFPHLRFQKPTCIEVVPQRDRLLVTEIGGKVFSFPANDPDVRTADLLLDLQANLPIDLRGRSVSLFDAAFANGFPQDPSVYLCYVHPGDGGHTRVSRFVLEDDRRIDPASEEIIITWPSGGHNGGCLEMGRDGSLYISTGDGSGPNPPDGLTSGQDVSDLLGAILRIRPESGGTYRIPQDNPFVGMTGARPEIWAYGLRNPWKFGIDHQTQDLFVADNGWETWEMVHRVERGTNCGWPVMEGRVSLRSEVPIGPTPITPPVKDHPHTEANSVVGGPVYRGEKLPHLGGCFVYGDYITGTIWAIRRTAEGAYVDEELVDTDQRIIAFTEGRAGELFVLDFDFTGQVYELAANPAPDLSASFPRRLSETGLFTSLETLEPAPGVVPYDVTASRWSDGASAQRWIAIPGNGAARLPEKSVEAAEFPEGTVFAKQIFWPTHGDQPEQRVEMQILHFESGVWQPYSYLWDESGHDATLVESRGTRRTIRVPDAQHAGKSIDRTWHVSAVNECKLCHEAGAKFVLGFRANQLDRTTKDRGIRQLDALAQSGIVANGPQRSLRDEGHLVDPHDATQPLDARARSYLHANCSMCHHPGGNAIVSFHLRRDLPFDQLNTQKGTGIGTFGLEDPKLISPGEPSRSILLYRMSKLGYARMPYIGSHVVDSRGVSLIAEWIAGMKDAPASGGEPAGATEGRWTTTSGALNVATTLHRGTIPVGDVQESVAAGVASPSPDIRGLFETFLPESQRRKTLGPSFNPQDVLALRGDASRGQLIFFSDHARCRNCHDLQDRERSLGPTLGEINKKHPKADEFLQHVVQPSLKIDEPSRAHLAILSDGRVLSGLLLEKSDQVVVLKTLTKEIIRLPVGDVDELRPSEQSLMPERLLADLTAQEAADLLTFIRSVK